MVDIEDVSTIYMRTLLFNLSTMKYSSVLLLCFFIAASSYTANAQDKCLNFGIKAGIAYGTPIGPAEKGATGSPGLGPILGIYADYALASKWGLQTELYFVQKRSKFSSPVTDQVYSYPYNPISNPDTTVYVDTKFTGTVTGKFNNKYLEWPVMGYYQIGKSYRILAGPYLGYLLEAGNTGVANGIVGFGNLTVENEPFDEGINISEIDFGVVGALRYDTKFGINCELRVTTGLRSIYKPTYTLKEETVRNVYLQLTAGYRLHSLCAKPKTDKDLLGVERAN